MRRKILAHSVSVIIGLYLAYYSHNLPIMPSEFVANTSSMWPFFISQYWWLMIIFFIIGYGITIGIFYFFTKKNKNFY